MSLQILCSTGRMIRTITMITTIATAVICPARAGAQSAEEKAVVGVVERFFEGMLKADSTIMRATVAAGARLTSAAMREGTPSLNVIPMDQFISSVASRPAGTNEKIYQPEVRIDGDLATVWTFYTLHVGERFIHCGIDAFQLLRMGGDWKIVNVSDTRRTTNCDPPKM